MFREELEGGYADTVTRMGSTVVPRRGIGSTASGDKYLPLAIGAYVDVAAALLDRLVTMPGNRRERAIDPCQRREKQVAAALHLAATS